MAINGARLSRVEERLLSGLPLHKPAHLWTEAEVERFCAPGGGALVPDEDLARIVAELTAWCEAEGIELDELDELPEPEPVTEASGFASGSHGREPMALSCGCGVCEPWRRANNIPEPPENVEARRMAARMRELTDAHRRSLGLDPLPKAEPWRG